MDRLRVQVCWQSGSAVQVPVLRSWLLAFALRDSPSSAACSRLRRWRAVVPVQLSMAVPTPRMLHVADWANTPPCTPGRRKVGENHRWASWTQTTEHSVQKLEQPSLLLLPR